MTYVDDSHPSEFYRFDTSFFNCLPLSTMSTVAAEWIEVERDPNPLLPVNMNNQRLTSIGTTGKIFTPSLWDGASCSSKRIQRFEQIYSNCGKNSGGSSFPFAVWSRGGLLIFFYWKRPKYRVLCQCLFAPPWLRQWKRSAKYNWIILTWIWASLKMWEIT